MLISIGNIVRLTLVILLTQINDNENNHHYCSPIIRPKYEQTNKLDLKLSHNYYNNIDNNFRNNIFDKPRLQRRILNVPEELEDFTFDTQVSSNKIRLRTKGKSRVASKGDPFKITPISLPSLMIFIGIILLSALVVYIEMSFNLFENIIRYLDSEPISVIESNLKEMDYNTQRYIRKQRKKQLKFRKHRKRRDRKRRSSIENSEINNNNNDHCTGCDRKYRKKRRSGHHSSKQKHSKRIKQHDDHSTESEDRKITRINTRINTSIK